jgi:hypothetical protein
LAIWSGEVEVGTTVAKMRPHMRERFETNGVRRQVVTVFADRIQLPGGSKQLVARGFHDLDAEEDPLAGWHACYLQVFDTLWARSDYRGSEGGARSTPGMLGISWLPTQRERSPTRTLVGLYASL